jgi:hypothetical protein
VAALWFSPCEMPGMSHSAVGDVERHFVHTLKYGSTHGLPCSLHVLTVKGPWQVKLLTVSLFLNHPHHYVIPVCLYSPQLLCAFLLYLYPATNNLSAIFSLCYRQ